MSINGQILLTTSRTKDDKEDSELLTETALEQVNANRQFRDVAEFFNEITYLHPGASAGTFWR